MAKNRKEIDVSDLQIGQPGVATMSIKGDAAIEKSDIQVVENVDAGMKKAEMLAFMEELVTVVVHTTTDKNAEPVVHVANGGRNQFFPRGQEVTCKRKYIEVLARAKADSFRNEEYRDHEGNLGMRYPKSTSLKYPFSILRDDNPRGPQWLKTVLAEAA